jgi:predicted PurR-regulated permease PerM
MLTTDMDMTLQAFFRGQIVLGLIFGGIMICFYAAMGIHYALALGLFLGIWEIVPVIGPTIGFIPTYILVGIDGMDLIPMQRGWQLLIIFFVTQVLQWLKDNAVAPRYIGNVIGLHPIVIFIAIMLGAKLDGLAGIIYSLPVACVVNVLINHFAARDAAIKRSATYEQSGAVQSNAAAAALQRELNLAESSIQLSGSAG